jgi:glycosyltransferase involved in cell wall biosynthesis
MRAASAINPAEFGAGGGARSMAAIRNPRVLLLATQVFSTNGGVPVYMRRLSEVFAGYVDPQDGQSGMVALERVGAPSNRHKGGCLLRGAPVKPAYIQAAFRTAWEMRPHLVVAGHVGLAPVAWLLQQAHLARRFAVVLHGIEAWRRCDWTDRAAARDAAALVATTRYTADLFARHNGTSPERMRIIPLGLEERETVNPPPRQRTALEPLRVLAVSRLSSADCYKGIDTLIEAAARLEGRIRLEIAGTGDDQPRLQAMAQSLGAGQCVQFHGTVSDERLRELYAGCDVFALPSKGEGFGIVFLEAMRFGKPCIGGNHGGVPEVIDHGVNGILVEHGNTGQLVNALAELAASPERTAELGRNARDKVAAHYLFPAFASNWHRFLDELLGISHTTATTTLAQ